MTESKFNMWRACVSAVHLDNKVTSEERAWVEEKIRLLPFSKEQKDIIAEDLKNGKNFEISFKKITDKIDLAFLLNTLRVISYLDKDFSEMEKINFKKLEEVVLKGINLKAIENEINAMKIQSYHEDEVYKNVNKSSVFEKVHQSLMRFLNSGDY